MTAEDKEAARAAFKQHLDEHGCGCFANDGRPGCPDPVKHAEGHKLGGFSHCGIAMILWHKLPGEDKVCLA